MSAHVAGDTVGRKSMPSDIDDAVGRVEALTSRLPRIDWSAALWKTYRDIPQPDDSRLGYDEGVEAFITDLRTILAALAERTAERDAAQEALEPFAEVFDYLVARYDSGTPDYFTVHDYGNDDASLTFGDFRAARTASSPPISATGGGEALAHVANEWADMATSGLQWLKNVRDGISTHDEAIENMLSNLAHCQEARAALEAAHPQGKGDH